MKSLFQIYSSDKIYEFGVYTSFKYFRRVEAYIIKIFDCGQTINKTNWFAIGDSSNQCVMEIARSYNAQAIITESRELDYSKIFVSKGQYKVIDDLMNNKEETVGLLQPLPNVMEDITFILIVIIILNILFRISRIIYFKYKPKKYMLKYPAQLYRFVDTEYASCTICLEDFDSNEWIRKFNCEHIYHKKCVDEWLERHELCPNCNHNINQPLTSCTVEPSLQIDT